MALRPSFLTLDREAAAGVDALRLGVRPRATPPFAPADFAFDGRRLAVVRDPAPAPFGRCFFAMRGPPGGAVEPRGSGRACESTRGPWRSCAATVPRPQRNGDAPGGARASRCRAAARPAARR